MSSLWPSGGAVTGVRPAHPSVPAPSSGLSPGMTGWPLQQQGGCLGYEVGNDSLQGLQAYASTDVC